MATFTIPKQSKTIDTFRIRGEEFVILKKDYLEELIILMRSFIEGEKLLKEKKTRSFGEFLRSISRKGK